MRTRAVELVAGGLLVLVGLAGAATLATPSAVIEPWRGPCAERGPAADVICGVMAFVATTTLLVAVALLRHRRPLPRWSVVVVGAVVAVSLCDLLLLALPIAEVGVMCLSSHDYAGGSSLLLGEVDHPLDLPWATALGAAGIASSGVAWRRSRRPTPPPAPSQVAG